MTNAIRTWVRRAGGARAVLIVLATIALAGCGGSDSLTLGERLGIEQGGEALVTFTPPPGTYTAPVEVTIDLADDVLVPGEDSLYYEYLLVSWGSYSPYGVPLDDAYRAPVTVELTGDITLRVVAVAMPYYDYINGTGQNERLSDSEYTATYVVD